MSSVAVIDYGMGNLHSIAKALQHADSGVNVFITADTKVIHAADRVVFPGVGAIRDCMQALTELELVPALKQAAEEKPFLGICLGMQALLTDSEENAGTACLDLFQGHVCRFSDQLSDNQGQRLKIPHMGWNRVRQKSHPLWQGILQDTRFYFVHSYYTVPDHEQDSIANTEYGHTFSCALARNKVFAVQFHPEKSQAAGLRLLQNFLRWDGAA